MSVSAKRKKRKKPNKGAVLFELLLLAIIVLFVFQGDQLLKFGKQWLKLDHLELGRVAQIPYVGRNTETESSVFKAKNSIVISEEQQLKVYDQNGVLQYQGELNAAQTQVAGGEDFYIVAEIQRGELAAVDYKGTVLSTVNNLGPIRKLEISQNEAILIEFQDKKSIQLLNQQLQPLMSATIPAGEILEAKAFLKAETIAVAAIETSGNTLTTTIYQYALDGKLLGMTNLDSEIVYGLFADDKLRALTDSALYSLTPDGVVIQKDPYEGVLHGFTTRPGGVLLLTEALIEDVVENVQAFNLQTYDFKTYALKAAPVSSSYSQLLQGETYLLALSDTSLDLYDKDYALKVSIPNDDIYNKGFWINDKQLVLINDTTADLFEIKE